jgi:hypothetical protein
MHENNLRGKYIVTWLWLCMGFGLMIKFIWLFDTAHDYILQFTITCTRARTHKSVHSHIFTSAIPDLSYQLLTATAHNDWTSAVLWLTNSVTHQLTNWTHFSLTALLITSGHGPCRKHRSSIAVYDPLSSSFYSCCLVMDLHATVSSSHSFMGCKVLISTIMLSSPHINSG